MNNRIPVYALVALFLIAVIWRIANPPAPKPPGPLGVFPELKSSAAIGEMGPAAVNPSGTRWAAAWNEEDRAGKRRSAVWVISFTGDAAVHSEAAADVSTSSLSWADDDTIHALRVDSSNPATADKSEIVLLDAKTGKEKSRKATEVTVAQILSWPEKSSTFLAQLAGPDDDIKLAVMDESGKVTGKEVTAGMPRSARLGPDAATAISSPLLVYSVEDGAARGGRAYYIASAADGKSRHAFDLEDLPGKVEGLWLTEKAVQMVCSNPGAREDQFITVSYDTTTGKLSPAKGFGPELEATSTAYPSSMGFVTYNGGYSLNLVTGRVKKLFSYDKLDESDESWRQAIRDGRLYPQEKGGYVAVSYSGGLADIRKLDARGRPSGDLLRRQ